ncbi:MAG: TIGR03960 family B12-binding radical SAM protein [Planctomycetaceae bacterium]|nr:TIGR03960 family B12-binding radical SAM protein [Planctomycetaceae bacterium]
MVNSSLKDAIVDRLLPQAQTPAQYTGGEWNSVVKNHADVRGTLCLAFPDTYSIGMSHHGLQVLYHVMNRGDWACERAFCPMTDMEQLLRQHRLPLFSLETFTPLAEFDVLGFTLQYDLCYSNVLTMLDLAGIPLDARQRTMDHPLVIAGGPCAANPEPMSRFFDLFVLGDGEPSLPEVCDLWKDLKRSGRDRESLLAQIASRLPYVYVPRFYEPQVDGRVVPIHPDVPTVVEPCAAADLNACPLPKAPIVPFVECVHDRITIEIMRGCPGHCRFCQSTTLKRPLRYRSVDTIVQTALDQYHATGYNEISLLSLSSSDYPHFDELMRRLQETFRPLGVSVSLPSLRINEQLRQVGELLNTDRHSGLTLAPEAARETMRRRIGKPITDEDLLAGCRHAFENGFSRVKLYFLCGLPDEQPTDLEGIVELSERISRLGREVRGRLADVVANVSNFVPKPQTPFQWHAMQRREYFSWAHDLLRRTKQLRSVQLKCHDIETSLLEGALCRGDRRTGDAIELAWRRGARFDGWAEHFQSAVWWPSLADRGIDLDRTLHTPCPAAAALPWDHLAIHQGRSYLERQRDQAASVAQD